MTVQHPRATRRAFLAGAGLVIGLALAPRAFAAGFNGVPATAQGPARAINAFVRIAPDGTVTVLSKHIEFGQGPYTGLATIVAEELDADWSQMRAAAAPSDDEVYNNLAFAALGLTLQGTGGSSSIANSYEQMRMAGATARALLVLAAAATWRVKPEEVTVAKGRVAHAASGRETGFGELADLAGMMPVPKEVKLKDPKDFTLIGTDRPKLDTPSKTDGSAIYTIDIDADDMLIAMVAHPDHFGATVRGFDATEALAVPGVTAVKQIPQGVAVYAENTWAALKGRDALKVEWDLTAAEIRSTEQIYADYATLFAGDGLKAAEAGDVANALGAPGVTVIENQIVFPFLAHAPMEPLDAVLLRNEDGTIDAYNGAQFPGMDQRAIAAVVGIDPAMVRVNTQMTGGSFGRRAQFGSPYMREAAEAFKASGMARPMKHLWTREDDLRGGYYRPIYVHSLRGGIDASGAIVGWDQKIAGQSIMGQTDLDPTTVEGAADMPYAIPHLRVFAHQTQLAVPVLWWRSVGHTHTGFAVETFVDQLLEAGGKDPVDGRLALLGDKHPRHAGVLARVAEIADWGGPVAEGRQRGVALHKSFNTYVAEIAEVSIENGMPRVHKVWVAVDCGTPINPNIIKAQMEGGVGYGLGAVLFDQVSLGEGGRIVQSNFHDYRSLRINEMPEVEVAIVASTEPPTGVGEPGVPPVGPAVANAWRRLTGQPVRRLPLASAELS